MLNRSDFILLMQESWKRFWTKTPKYFRVWGWINIGVAALGAIPEILKMFEVTLPATWMLVTGKLLIAAGLWGKLNNRLVMSVPDEKNMPFTVKKNIQEEERVDKILKNAIL